MVPQAAEAKFFGCAVCGVRSTESITYNGPPLPHTRGSSQSQAHSKATPEGGRRANKSGRQRAYSPAASRPVLGTVLASK